MAPVAQTTSSTLKLSRLSALSAAKHSAEIPFVRKRLLSEQTIVLMTVFEEKTHPTREERAILAAELGMQLKTVSAWFQNRRRTLKKKSLVWRGNSAKENQRAPPAAGKGSAVSLDRIVAARERPPPVSSTDPLARPLSSSYIMNLTRALSLPSPNNGALWEHIPSSPPHPPSSPIGESVRLEALGRYSKASRSLEWACEFARKSRKSGDRIRIRDVDVSPLDLDDTSVGTEYGGSDTETEDFEAITPDSSAAQLLPGVSPMGGVASKSDTPPAEEDMEAAMALLGFMGNPA